MPKPSEPGVVTGPNNTSTASTDGPATGTQDFGRYWLEILTPPIEISRVAGVLPLASGQPFKFHFQLEEDGYIYIIGPGEQNQPTAFLTAKPAAISGVESNRLKKGSDFSFPSGIEHWLELDKKPGTEVYTIIFSPTALSSPAFLTAAATGKPLTQAEQEELNSFLAKNQGIKPTTELNDKNNAEPFVLVRIPQSGSAGNPIVFQIRIQHK
jgi:hypothetical protein